MLTQAILNQVTAKFYVYDSPIGPLYALLNNRAIQGLYFTSQMDDSLVANMAEFVVEDHPLEPQVRNWLDQYFQGLRPDPNDLPLEPLEVGATPFRQQIWSYLLEIPYGQVVTYKDLAHTYCARHGKKAMSAQAIGGAVGHNPIGIIIPCHRVLGSNGNLTGYTGGLDIKRALLEHEGITDQK